MFFIHVVILFTNRILKTQFFFTEKTWKEYAFKRPFLLLGAKNQNNILKKLGFDLSKLS